MMTREEAIAYFEDRVAWAVRMEISHRGDAVGRYATELHEYANFALAALRGPTREMVERMRGEWIPVGDDAFYNTCSRCEKISVGKRPFCPFCGAPMMDEAVDMTLERWKEAVNNEA